MGRHCYCAFCSGPLGISVEVGSKDMKSLEKRRERLEKIRKGLKRNKRKLQGGDVGDSEGDDDKPKVDNKKKDVEMANDAVASGVGGSGGQNEAEVQASDEVVDEGRKNEGGSQSNEAHYHSSADHSMDDEDANDNDVGDDDVMDHGSVSSVDISIDNLLSMDDRVIDGSYDPTVITKSDVQWTMDCRCLGFNTQAMGVTNVFLSARGMCDTDGFFEAGDHAAIDNDDPGDLLMCYAFGADMLPAFPFHMECYGIVARCMTGKPDKDRINKDALYSAMASIAKNYAQALPLDYGGIQGNDQFWTEFSGEEVSSIRCFLPLQ
jgi:hypothetical protein